MSAIRANQKLPAKKRRPLEDCITVAHSLDLSKPLKEPVNVWLKNKPKGYRIIHDHGLKHRTAQDLVKRVMDVVFVPRPFQFTHLGVQAAIKQTKALISAGYVHAAHLDIKNFYGSFELEKLLNELPLPKEVVEHAVAGRHMETTWDPERMKGKTLSPSLSSHTVLQLEARLGIPQGSACSSIIDAYCMARLQWFPIADVVLLNYADDFLLLATSVAAREKAIDGLTEAVGNLPGGNFKLVVKEKSAAASGVTFLGHLLQTVGGKLTTWPREGYNGPYRPLGKLDNRLGKCAFQPGALSGALGKFNKPEALLFLARYQAVVDGWRAAFSECDQVDRILENAYLNVTGWLGKIGATPADLNKAITPDMEYIFELY